MGIGRYYLRIRNNVIMDRNELINEACRVAGLKPGFDREEELYYQKHKVEIYDAFLAGHDLLRTN